METVKTALDVKYRPKTWAEVEGEKNKKTVNRLKKVLGRGEKTFLLLGPRGCGKTSIARLISREIGCAKSQFYELNTANMRGIDTSREIIEDSKYPPMVGDYKVFFIDEAHTITGPASEALLKVVEEPPKYAYFIFATTEPQKLIKTLVDRCTSFRVFPLNLSETKAFLSKIITAEKIVVTEKVLDKIVLVSEGRPRRALKLLNQIRDEKSEEEMLDVLTDFEVDQARALPSKDSPLHGLTLQDFDKFKGLTYLIEEILPANCLIVLGGKAGIGKTLVAETIRNALLRSDKYPDPDDGIIRLFRRYGVFRGGPVLSIDQENRPEIIKDRLQKTWLRSKVTNRFIGQQHSFECLHDKYMEIKLEDKITFKKLKEKIREFKPILIIIDSLSTIHKGSDSSASKMTFVMKKLNELVNEGENWGMSILVIHHHARAGWLRGSTAIAAGCDIEYSLKEDDNEYLILKSEKTRIKSFGPIRLELDASYDIPKLLYEGEISEDMFEELKKTLQGRGWVDIKAIYDELAPNFPSLKHGKLRYTLKKYTKDKKIDEDSTPNPKGGKPILKYRLK